MSTPVADPDGTTSETPVEPTPSAPSGGAMRARKHRRRLISGYPRRAQRTPKESALAFLREVVIVVVGALLISFLVRTFLLQPFAVPSESMENTLLAGDKITVSKWGVKPQRGDVVVFEDFARWLKRDPAPRAPWQVAMETIGLLPDSSENHLVKRIIGMPGDTVKCCDSEGRVTVNGQPLDEKDYLYPGVSPSDFPFTVVVPIDRVFVMGDHRNRSSDSRCHLRELGKDAFVPIDKIVGPVSSILLPLNRFTLLKRPATFDRIPAPSQAPPAEPTIKLDLVTCG